VDDGSHDRRAADQRYFDRQRASDQRDMLVSRAPAEAAACARPEQERIKRNERREHREILLPPVPNASRTTFPVPFAVNACPRPR